VAAVNEQISLLVDVWTVAWTVVLGLGYLADHTPFPRLSVLRQTGVVHAMMLSSAAVVLGLTLGERSEAAAILTAWAVLTSSVKLLWDSWETGE
jgi:hypothetical protein